MRAKAKETAARLLILFVGLVIAHLGVTLFMLTEMGNDPFNVLIEGLTVRFVGSGLLTPVHWGVSILIVVILLLTDRHYVKLGTLVCMGFGGPIIDGFKALLGNMPIRGVEPAVLVLACGILAFGMSLVIRSDAGTGPNDLVAVVISDKTHAPFSVVRVATDATFVLTGALLGGTYGVGTLVCAFLVGPIAGLCMPFSGRVVARCVSALTGEKRTKA